MNSAITVRALIAYAIFINLGFWILFAVGLLLHYEGPFAISAATLLFGFLLWSDPFRVKAPNSQNA